MLNAKCRIRRIASFVIVATMLLAPAGCSTKRFPALPITGDCEEYSVTSGMPLGDAIESAKPRAEEFDVLLMGKDGLVSRISGGDLDGCELLYSEENAWEAKSEFHPPSARIKDLAQIAVIDASLNIGRLLLQDGLYTLKEEGTSSLKGHKVTVYTTLDFVPVGEMNFIAGVSDVALGFLEQGKRVMVIELDGLGWERLIRAGEEFAPYLHSLDPGMALACYPPDSRTGLMALLGVREDGDIFERTAKLGKTSAYIEGSHVPVGSSLRPVMSLSDEEVYHNTLEALAAEPDLIFVHFHGIDDTAQEVGPHKEQAMQKIMEIDGYVQSLVEGFPGRVIITADHGMHAAPEGGDHGIFSAEDMLVPYIIK